jgi:hypothetical protein
MTDLMVQILFLGWPLLVKLQLGGNSMDVLGLTLASSPATDLLHERDSPLQSGAKLRLKRCQLHNITQAQCQ